MTKTSVNKMTDQMDLWHNVNMTIEEMIDWNWQLTNRIF